MRPLLLFVRWLLPGSLALLLAACTDSYMPDVVANPESYLVVDGFINSQGITTIKLSRTYAIASTTAPPVETKATVYVEEEGGTRYALREAPAGTYTSANLTLSPARKYRLSVRTQAGQDYASDFLTGKMTPPIDAVTYRTDNDQLSIRVSTHDDTGNTQYYRWETDETWEILPVYRPNIEYANGGIQPIVVPFPTICWGNAHSTSIYIDKTTGLTQDVISAYQLRQLASRSERLYSRYSILVQQQALTSEEYAYWELLRKNTENIGSLFDPQPAQVTGNVHSTSSATEIVLGFVGVHSRTEKRIFIAHTDLPQVWPRVSGYESCLPPDSVFLTPKGVFPPPTLAEVLQTFASQQTLPINTIYLNGFVVGYLAKPRGCIDCRTRGAATKPSYWP